ncbi:MAG: hypothetical protein ACXVYB_00330 [Arthrobacter sp.]
MSKRKYDHLRFRENEDRRLMALIHQYPGHWPDEPSGDVMVGNSPEVSAFLDQQEARSVRRPCANGNCIVVWDPKRREVMWSMGPVGCCDE